MWKLEHRRRHSTDGLKDDIVLIGHLSDFKELSAAIITLSDSECNRRYSISIQAPYNIDIEINVTGSEIDSITPPFLYGEDLEKSKLPSSHRPLASLQNERGEYFTGDEWTDRNILKVRGNKFGLLSIAEFLNNPLWNSSMHYAYLKAAYNIDGVLDPNSCDLRVQIERT